MMAAGIFMLLYHQRVRISYPLAITPILLWYSVLFIFTIATSQHHPLSQLILRNILCHARWKLTPSLPIEALFCFQEKRVRQIDLAGLNRCAEQVSLRAYIRYFEVYIAVVAICSLIDNNLRFGNWSQGTI